MASQNADDNAQRFVAVRMPRSAVLRAEDDDGPSLEVTQIAFPDAVNSEVYGSGVYTPRGSNPTTNLRDGIFADSLNSELASVSGNSSAGYAATFMIRSSGLATTARRRSDRSTPAA